MTLMEQIRSLQLEARKARKATASALYTTLIGEAAMVGKNDGNRESTDAEVVTVIKKFLKNNGDAQAVLIDSMSPDDDFTPPGAVKLMDERELLEALLPSQITGDRLRGVIESMKNEINAGPKDMGKIMGLLKQRFDGQYDGKEASALVKEVLA